jgi:hypothetical protein
MRSIFRTLHSSVANAVIYLANTGAAFVTCESRLMAASFEAGGVEASLVGKALQTSFDDFSPLVRARKLLLVSPTFERLPVDNQQARSSVHPKSLEDIKSTTRRRAKGGAMSRRRGD